MQVWLDISAEEGEETGNGESVITISNDLEVNVVSVIVIGKKRNHGVDGNHEQDSNDAAIRQ